MVTDHRDTQRTWTVAEAKARLSEILRLAEEEGPQRIGAGKTFVVAPEREWRERELAKESDEEKIPFGRWLVENMPRGTNFEIPRDWGAYRPIPFVDYDFEDDDE